MLAHSGTLRVCVRRGLGFFCPHFKSLWLSEDARTSIQYAGSGKRKQGRLAFSPPGTRVCYCSYSLSCVYKFPSCSPVLRAVLVSTLFSRQLWHLNSERQTGYHQQDFVLSFGLNQWPVYASKSVCGDLYAHGVAVAGACVHIWASVSLSFSST